MNNAHAASLTAHPCASKSQGLRGSSPGRLKEVKAPPTFEAGLSWHSNRGSVRASGTQRAGARRTRLPGSVLTQSTCLWALLPEPPPGAPTRRPGPRGTLCLVPRIRRADGVWRVPGRKGTSPASACTDRRRAGTSCA